MSFLGLNRVKAVRYQQIKASFFDHHKNENIKASNRGKIPQIQCRLRYHQLDFRVLMKALRLEYQYLHGF